MKINGNKLVSKKSEIYDEDCASTWYDIGLIESDEMFDPLDFLPRVLISDSDYCGDTGGYIINPSKLECIQDWLAGWETGQNEKI